MHVELWRFICSWEKASKAQTKRSAGATCSGNSEIEFPSQRKQLWLGGQEGGVGIELASHMAQ